MSKITQEAIEPLDWANFDEIKLNRGWVPDDQELIYTAINAYNGEGDMDDDCLEQIIERLLLAWRRADATRAQGAEVEPIAYTNSLILEFNVNGNFIIDAMIFPKGKLRPEQEVALYTAPPAPQPTEREQVLACILRALIVALDRGDPTGRIVQNARAALTSEAPSQTGRAEEGE